MSSSIVFHFVFCYIYVFSVYMYVCVWACHGVCGGQRSEVRVGFSFFHVGAGTLTQVVGLGSNCLYLLSHPHTGPPPYFSRQDLALDRELTDRLGCLAKELRGSALLH